MTTPKVPETVVESVVPAEAADKPTTGYPLAAIPSTAAVDESAETLVSLALSPGVQTLWAALLPLVGVRASGAGEFPGYFQVEAGTTPNEALVHIDIPSAAYDTDAKPLMNRVVSLSVKLAHDFRRLGDQYYCVDCEVPDGETRH